MAKSFHFISVPLKEMTTSRVSKLRHSHTYGAGAGAGWARAGQARVESGRGQASRHAKGGRRQAVHQVAAVHRTGAAGATKLLRPQA